MKNKILVLCFILSSSLIYGQEKIKDSTEYNPLTKFVGSWEGDYIRTLDGEEEVFFVCFEAKFMDTGKGLTVTFYSTNNNGKFSDPWLDVVYFYNKSDKKIYAMGGLHNDTVDISEATVNEVGSIQIVVRRVGRDKGSYNLNTWRFPSDNEIIFESTTWENYQRGNRSAIAKSKRINQ